LEKAGIKMEETAHIIKVETSRRGTAQEKEADSYVAIDLETTGLDPKLNRPYP
jgi:DNA polymerase-3 subunit epsilon